MNRKIVEQGGRCPICHEEFRGYSDIVPEPKGMGGGFRLTADQSGSFAPRMNTDCL
jgi:hypothetical protein